MKNPNTFQAKLNFGFQLTACLLWSVFPGTVGLLCFVSFFLAPVGMALMGLAAAPLAWVVARRNKAKAEWKWDEEEGEEVPWII